MFVYICKYICLKIIHNNSLVYHQNRIRLLCYLLYSSSHFAYIINVCKLFCTHIVFICMIPSPILSNHYRRKQLTRSFTHIVLILITGHYDCLAINLLCYYYHRKKTPFNMKKKNKLNDILVTIWINIHPSQTF